MDGIVDTSGGDPGREDLNITSRILYSMVKQDFGQEMNTFSQMIPTKPTQMRADDLNNLDFDATLTPLD